MNLGVRRLSHVLPFRPGRRCLHEPVVLPHGLAVDPPARVPRLGIDVVGELKDVEKLVRQIRLDARILKTVRGDEHVSARSRPACPIRFVRIGRNRHRNFATVHDLVALLLVPRAALVRLEDVDVDVRVVAALVGLGKTHPGGRRLRLLGPERVGEHADGRHDIAVGRQVAGRAEDDSKMPARARAGYPLRRALRVDRGGRPIPRGRRAEDAARIIRPQDERLQSRLRVRRELVPRAGDLPEETRVFPDRPRPDVSGRKAPIPEKRVRPVEKRRRIVDVVVGEGFRDERLRRFRERLRQEDRHLAPRVGQRRAVVPAAASRRDPVAGELLDPFGKWRARRNVAEDPDRRRRAVAAAVFGPQQEHRHLAAGDRVVRAVHLHAAARRNPFRREPLDPVGCKRRDGHIVEDGSRRVRRQVIGSVLTPQDEDRHLRPRDHLVRAVVAAAAAERDPTPAQLLDRAGEEVRRGDVEKASEPGIGERRIHAARPGHHDVVDGAGRQRRNRHVDLAVVDHLDSRRGDSPDRNGRPRPEVLPVDGKSRPGCGYSPERIDQSDLRIGGDRALSADQCPWSGSFSASPAAPLPALRPPEERRDFEPPADRASAPDSESATSARNHKSLGARATRPPSCPHSITLAGKTNRHLRAATRINRVSVPSVR